MAEEKVDSVLARLPGPEDGGFEMIQDCPTGVSFFVGTNPKWIIAVNEVYAAANTESGAGVSCMAPGRGYRALSAYAAHILLGRPAPRPKKAAGPDPLPPGTGSWTDAIKGPGWTAGTNPRTGRAEAYAFTDGISECVAGPGCPAEIRKAGKWLRLSFPAVDGAGYPITPERAGREAETIAGNASLIKKAGGGRRQAVPRIPNPDFKAERHFGNIRPGKRTVVITGSFARPSAWADGTERKRTKFRVWALPGGGFEAESSGKSIKMEGGSPDSALIPAVNALRDMLAGKNQRRRHGRN